MIEKYFRLQKIEHITLVQFILEGYEGMTTVSTIDSQNAIIKISIMSDFVEIVDPLIKELTNSYSMEQLNKVN